MSNAVLTLDLSDPRAADILEAVAAVVRGRRQPQAEEAPRPRPVSEEPDEPVAKKAEKVLKLSGFRRTED